ncbi:bacterial Ig-like domain-containing protein, partial [Enterococcus sp. 3H8_DIV0648]|uniref:bacterial Ig-like domain-containing protein n=2 Tax=Enterococcus TaxID=1350 RepID=UPI000B7304D5
MKKKRIITLGTIALTLASQTIYPALNYAAESAVSSNRAESNTEHVVPNIDWSNWQPHGTGGQNQSIAGALPLDPFDGTTMRKFKKTMVLNYGQITGEVTIPSIEFTVVLNPNAFVIRVPLYSSGYAWVSNITLTNETTGGQWKLPVTPTDLFGAQYNDYLVNTKDAILNSGDTITIDGNLNAKDTNTAQNDSFWAELYSGESYARVTKVAKVYYKDALTGKDLLPEEVLGNGMKLGTTVSASAKEVEGYAFTGNSLVTPDTISDGPDKTITTILKAGGPVISGNRDTTGEQAIVFWYKAADKTAITTHDSTIYVNDSWDGKENFDSAINKDGTPLNYEQFISAGGTIDSSQLDTTKIGTYPVVYKLNNVSSTANITVLANQQSITGSDVTKYVNDPMPE